MSLAQVLPFVVLMALPTLPSKPTCPRNSHSDNLEFGLARTFQRSEMPAIAYKNTLNLEDCLRAAKAARGLALNFGLSARREKKLQGSEVFQLLHSKPQLQQITQPNGRRYIENRQSVWQRPQEHFNCHILACPENKTMRSLVNDSRYDYYSLYGEPVASSDYTCVPQVGLFQLQVAPANFQNAKKFCQNATVFGGVSTLAHVVSAARTNAFADLLRAYNRNARQMRERQHTLAYVGLHFNRTYKSQPIEYTNMEKEPLRCFQFAAWAPGHPRIGETFANLSCIAVTSERTWLTVDCERELPFICEIYTSRGGLNEIVIDAGTCAPNNFMLNTRFNKILKL